MPDPHIMEATGDFRHGIADVIGTQTQVVLQDHSAFDGADDISINTRWRPIC